MMMGSRPPAAMRPTGVGGVGGSGRMVRGWGMLGLDGMRGGLRGCGTRIEWGGRRLGEEEIVVETLQVQER